MRLRPTLLAGMGGALLAYLLDPGAGARRRHRLAGRSKGIVHELRPDQQPENAQTLVDKVRSEVLGAEQWRNYIVNVGAADGVVMLNGQLDRPEQVERLVHEVRQVTGVRDVENALHLPGTLPPNKRSAMTARAT